MKNRKKYVERIKQLRNKKGLSLRKLQPLVNIDFSRISDIENGKVNVTIDTLDKIINTLENYEN